VTARKPLVPPELRELVTLVSQLMAPLPLPAGEHGGAAAGWEARRDAADRRSSVAGATMLGLAVTLEAADAHPEFYPEVLAGLCRRDSERVRAELAKPLGYEQRADREAGG
jgi:hypothetical protein